MVGSASTLEVQNSSADQEDDRETENLTEPRVSKARSERSEQSVGARESHAA